MISQKELSQKIKKLRNEFGLSQEEFAKKIGLSRVAVSQLEIGKRGLSTLELVKIAKVFGVSVDFLLQDQDDINKKEIHLTKNKNKQFIVNKDKLKNTILYILEKCGGKPNVGETVLYKLLYFADFDNYEMHNEPITKMNYIKLQFGPMPCKSEYSPIIKEMIANNQLKIITQNYHNRMQKKYIALTDCNVNVFRSSELEIINEVISRLSDMNARQIENYVHDDTPWRESKDKEIINYDLVFYRSPRYSKRDYELEMQNSAATDYLKNETIGEEEYNYYENL